MSSFSAGNPTDTTDYVQINVRQEGEFDNIWSADVQGYTAEPMGTNVSHSANLMVDPGDDSNNGYSRTFSAEIYVDDQLVGGMEFTGFCDRYPEIIFVWVILIVFFIIVALVIYWALKDDNVETT